MDFKKLLENSDFDDYKSQRNIIKRYLRDANLLLNNNGSITTLCEVLEWIKTFCDSLIMIEDNLTLKGYNMEEIAKALEVDNDSNKTNSYVKI